MDWGRVEIYYHFIFEGLYRKAFLILRSFSDTPLNGERKREKEERKIYAESK